MKHKGKNPATRLILVTGGAGYKGSTLCRDLLARGYAVRILDNLMYGGRSIAGLLNHPRLEFIRGEVNNPKDVDKALKNVTDVIHLAAIVGDKPCERDPKRAVDVNLKGTMLLAEKVKKKRIGYFLFASTCSNYGITDSNVPVKEEGALNPVSLYAETKIDCEKLLSQMAQAGHFHPVMFRFGTAFGVSGRTRFDLTVNSFTYEALRDRKILVFSEESWRPFVHVLDIARIYLKALTLPYEKISGKILNGGWTKQNYMKKDIINDIKKVIGDFQVDYVNTVDDKRSYRVDFSKIEFLLGLSPVMPLKQGIEELAMTIQTGILTEDDFETNRLK
jgi:nucleoside-diphosphate-sugar epimerase